ncbi:galectin-3-binding protein A [Stegastes partitus]|uniref:Galectin-3-binding protein n=1 Tax=Stegastes partitus TaxID=144197 RepID=A0A3B4ZD74_9TELE|nr:PREDICTED: galectin-3-binding protein [Stegastes partitus]XP_008301387.1 PREDICTED: galectin-3-binding protein [Stegastes partitus]
MLVHRTLSTVWVLLLLNVSGRAMKFNLFNQNLKPQEGDVRLFGSQNISEGRVEVYHDGIWGTVCDDNWDMAEAQVVCRQLNFPGAKSVVIGKNYGQAPGPIWLDDINCKGTEKQLATCAFSNWGETDCSHKEDVGVICETGSADKTISDSTHSLDHSISLSDDLGQIFDSGNDCDFRIFVRSPSGNKQDDGTPQMVETTICAHKVILSQFPLFKASVGIANITININPSCLPHFTSFIRYIYTRKMDVTFSSALCLHQLASNFGIEQLKADIGRLFSKILPDDDTFQNQVSIYKYAVGTKDLILEENCLRYMAWNYENLTMSPAWTGISVELLGALLTRSDLVVPDEYFVLQSVESWITEMGKSTSLETQVDLLSRIRFPMIPAEKLYELDSSSLLYSAHKDMYLENMLKAFQFNVLLFGNLTNPKYNKHNDDYQPRIYTAEPWSAVIDLSTRKTQYQYAGRYDRRYQQNYLYSQSMTKFFSTPAHNSLLFKDKKISWRAYILQSQYECSNQGLRCESVPMARLVPQNQIQQGSNILFRNQLLMICKGKYVCQVQGFKGYMAPITVNDTQVLSYPCPDDKYTYQFVVRPEYV